MATIYNSAGVITTGSFPRLLQEGVQAVFGNELNEHDPEWNQMFASMMSDKNFEVNVQAEGFSRSALKGEGDDISFDSRRQGFTPKYVHSTRAKGFIVTEEALDDELYGQLNDGAQALGRAMRIGKEIDGADILNNGFDANFTMIDGDGQPLFSLTHSNGPSGGTYSNRLTVDAALSEASAEDLLGQIDEAEDARGLPAAIMGVKLVVGPGTNKFNAQRILGSVLQNDTGNNATNAMRDMNSIQDGWMTNHYLTDNDAWFIITNATNGLKHYERRPLRFGQDNAFTSGNARFKADWRYVFGWDDARGVYGSPGP